HRHHDGTRREDHRDAPVRTRADQEGRQPGGGPDGDAQRHGLRVRPAPLRPRPQRRNRFRFPGGPVRTVHARRRRGEKLMDLDIDAESAAFRDEVRAWLATNVPTERLPSMDTAEGFAAHREWEGKLADARLSTVTWPEQYGGREAALLQWV